MTAEHPLYRNFRFSSCIVTLPPRIVSGREYSPVSVFGGEKSIISEGRI